MNPNQIEDIKQTLSSIRKTVSMNPNPGFSPGPSHSPGYPNFSLSPCMTTDCDGVVTGPPTTFWFTAINRVDLPLCSLCSVRLDTFSMGIQRLINSHADMQANMQGASELNNLSEPR